MKIHLCIRRMVKKGVNMNMHLLSGILSFAMAVSILPSFPVIAEETTDLYPYTMFAASDAEGTITINSNNFSLNGNIATNGTIASSGNMNINGIKTENANEEMVYILEKLDALYFSGDNVDIYSDDYNLEDLNININDPMDVYGSVELTGNISLSSGIKAFEDVQINGEVKNTSEAVICSETGDIVITSTNVNFSGLIYAPYGNIIIDTDNLNLNNVIIIGQTITLDCPSINANYNSSMGKVVGTEASTGEDNVDGDEDIVLYAFGEYNAEANSIDIEWETNYTNSSYEVWCSDDNVNYTSVVVVSGEMTYQYPIVEDFDIKYFKVSLTTNYGELVESIPFVVTRDEDGYTVDYLDTDGDGLPDIYEEALGTDVNKTDTDEDGLTDYQEVFVTGTDPTKYDSVAEGVSDADADSDGDGLSNAQEIELDTDPQNTDTDEDGLSDFDELNVYGTDPLNPDTDSDGLKDGDEPHIGLEPTNPETFGYPDSKYYVYQEIDFDSEVFSEINKEDSPYKLSVSMVTNGYAESNMKANTSRYSNAIENDAMLGVSADINISDFCNPKDIVIKYSINDNYIDNTLNKYTDCDEFEDIKRLNIFKFYDDINMLLPIETKFDIENNTLYAEVDELGTYCIMDMEIWFDTLGVDVDYQKELDIDINEVNLLDATNQLSILSQYATVKKSTYLDVVYMIQTSGLRSEVYLEQVETIRNFSDYIFSNFSNARIYVIAYDTYSSNLVSVNNGKKYVEDIDDLNLSLNKLSYKYSNVYAESYHAFSIVLNQLNYRKSNCTFIYNFINGNINFYETIEPTVIAKRKMGVYSQIAYSSWDYIFEATEYGQMVTEAIDAMGGLIINEDNNTASKLAEHLSKKDLPNPTQYEFLLALQWRKITLQDELSPTNGVDSDQDSLTDWEEVNTDLLKWNDDGTFELPTFFDLYTMFDAVDAFRRWEGTEYELPIYRIYQTKILPVISNPCTKDSDCDGIDDDNEICPIDDISNEFYSNPLSADSDDDGISDFIDPQPLNHNLPKNIDWDVWKDVNVEDYMERRNITEMVFKGVHHVALFNYHTSVIVFANTQSTFYNNKHFTESVVNWENVKYTTFGAGPFEFPDKDPMVAGYNREKDIMLDIKVQMINLTTCPNVNNHITNLIENQDYFMDNSKPAYDLFPDNDTEYNSNSYAVGLLHASGIDDLWYPSYKVPGYKYPVPSIYFGVTNE